MNDFSALGGNMREAARASLGDALASMALLKNLVWTPEECAQVAADMLAEMSLAQLREISALDRDGLAARSKAASTHLDKTAIVRVAEFVSAIEGKDRIDDPAVTAIVQEIIGNFEDHLTDKRFIRWPGLWQLVESRYADKPRGPTVGVREDGTVCTRWWLGLDFHRDPKDGPANIEVKGDRRREEYHFKGQLHRPYEDGPAMIDTAIYGFELHCEEYREHGVLHRPSELGPAVRQTDRTGRVVLEIYAEQGQLHRDPKQGPAWFEIRDATTMKGTPDDTTLLQYCWKGEGHRDEADGAAVMTRDNKTGLLLVERYYRDGLIHRDHGPAETERRVDGTLFRETWLRNGEWHRTPGEGPASVIRQGNGITFDEWHVMGNPHRDPKEGPARIRRDLDKGTVQEEFWIEGNYRPATEGPALVTRSREGEVIEHQFWDGERLHAQPPEPVRAEANAHG